MELSSTGTEFLKQSLQSLENIEWDIFYFVLSFREFHPKALQKCIERQHGAGKIILFLTTFKTLSCQVYDILEALVNNKNFLYTSLVLLQLFNVVST